MVTFAYEWVAAKYNLLNLLGAARIVCRNIIVKCEHWAPKAVSDSEEGFARELRICKTTGKYKYPYSL